MFMFSLIKCYHKNRALVILAQKNCIYPYIKIVNNSNNKY